MRRYAKCCWIVVLAVLLGGLSGCNSENGSPAAPQAPSATGDHPLANFYTMGGVSDRVAVFSEPGQLVVQALPGTYLLAYTVGAGTYRIVFTAHRTALLYIGLLDKAQAQEVTLYPGTIKTGAQPLQSTDNVSVFALPGGSVAWQDVFVFAANS